MREQRARSQRGAISGDSIWNGDSALYGSPAVRQSAAFLPEETWILDVWGLQESLRNSYVEDILDWIHLKLSNVGYTMAGIHERILYCN